MDNNAVSGCTGKHRFADQGLARQIARQTSRRHECAMSAYECKHCGGWHVGQRDQFQKTKKRGD